MGLFNIFDPGLDFLFGPLLKLPPILGILVISLIITLIVTIIYKYTTDQVLLKSIRDKQKKLQEEMKKHREDPKKMMKLQKEAFSQSGDMMKESFKSMFYTFIPIIIMFGWIGTHFAFTPLQPGEQFNVTLYLKAHATGDISASVPDGISLISPSTMNVTELKQIDFTFKAEKQGDYNITFAHNGDTFDKKIVIGAGDTDIRQTKMSKTWIDYIYGSREGFLPQGDVYQLKVDYDTVKPLEVTHIPWIDGFGWLGTYIIFSIILSLVIRKLMKVY